MSLELRKAWTEAQARMQWLKLAMADNTLVANQELALTLARAICAESEYIAAVEHKLMLAYDVIEEGDE